MSPSPRRTSWPGRPSSRSSATATGTPVPWRSPTSSAPGRRPELRGRRGRRGAARRRRDRAGRRRRRTCSPGRDGASGRRCPRRCSGSRSPTRTPATTTEQLQFRASSALLRARRGDEDLAAGPRLRPRRSTARRPWSASTRRWRSRATSCPAPSPCASSSTTTIPEDEPTTRQMLGEMLRLTEAADTRLDEQAEAFAQLRDLENTAPAGARGARPADRRAARAHPAGGAAAGRAAAAVRRRRRSRRSPTTSPRRRPGWPPPSRRCRRRATPSAAGQPGDAVGDIRAAEDAVAQTGTLLDAVGRLATDLDAAAGRVAAVRAETEKDLAEARSLVASGDRERAAARRSRARRRR